MSTAILFSNSDQTTFVLDIPASIATSQGGGQLLSVEPPSTPYLTPEPKGHKRDVHVARSAPEDVAYHEEIQALISRTSLTIAPLDRWCLPRKVSTVQRESIIPCASNGTGTPIVLSPMQNDFRSGLEVQNALVTNDGRPTTVALDGRVFLIPRECRFIWADVENTSIILEDLPGRHKFRFVLMDPPWSNKSLHNARNYATMDYRNFDVFHQACSIAVGHCLPSGYIAIWITNKHAIRSQAIEKMSRQGFGVVEEWVWVKVTCKGEPVTVLNGVWRKPYEILLIFRQPKIPNKPQRRLVYAVPDVHSRKPNLKPLFDLIFGKGSTMELFARNVTAGWLSVGNEVLKFQDNTMWHDNR